jgi:hypothetical protein
VKLYSYFRSSAAYRVRIALNLKGISYEMIPIHLTKDGGRQHTPEYRTINPQARVPALVLPGGEVLTLSNISTRQIPSRRCCRQMPSAAPRFGQSHRRSPATFIL